MKLATIQRGFTIIEMMVALAVFAILVAIAVPSFKDATLRTNIKSVANELQASSYLARSEAIKRNGVVQLCSSTDGETCDGTAWKNGWIVFFDHPDPAEPDVVVQRRGAVPHGIEVSDTTGGLTDLDYQPTGFGATVASFKVCRKLPEVGREERRVVVDASGKAYVQKTKEGTCT